MTENVSEQVDADTQKLLSYMDREGLDASEQVTRGYTHMGGLIAHSALQRLRKSDAVVRPRVDRLIDTWPDANTTTDFLLKVAATDAEGTGYGALGEVLPWRGPERLIQMVKTAEVFDAFGIDTVEQLRAALTDPVSRAEVQQRLRKVHNVGPKTRDFIDILAGLNESAAIDVRIKLAADGAGIANQSYGHLSAVLHEAARIRGWRVGDLDALLWKTHEP